MNDQMDTWEQIGCIAMVVLSGLCVYVFLLTLRELAALVW